jgi:hypothetical protein
MGSINLKRDVFKGKLNYVTPQNKCTGYLFTSPFYTATAKFLHRKKFCCYGVEKSALDLTIDNAKQTLISNVF